MSWTLREATLAHRVTIIMGLVMCLFFGFRIAVPASHWFEVPGLEVHSAAHWQDVRVDYQRTIRHQFEGAWRVEVARREANGFAEVCATANNPNTYEVDAIVAAADPASPTLVTLDWFTGPPPACYELPPADYRLCAVWTINTDSFLGVMTRSVRRCDEFAVVGG